jgi:polyphosphate kinase
MLVSTRSQHPLARDLERAGVRSCLVSSNCDPREKKSLVVRREDGRLRNCCISAPQHHPVTARICRPVLLHHRSDTARDVAQLFNFITGYAGRLMKCGWRSRPSPCEAAF